MNSQNSVCLVQTDKSKAQKELPLSWSPLTHELRHTSSIKMSLFFLFDQVCAYLNVLVQFVFASFVTLTLVFPPVLFAFVVIQTL